MTVDDVLSWLKSRREALPDPDALDGISPRTRENLHHERTTLSKRWRQTRTAADLLVHIAPKEAEDVAWREHLLAAKAAHGAEAEQITLDGLRGDERRAAYERQQALLASVNAIDCGVHYYGAAEALPEALWQLLSSRGVRSLDGQTGLFAGRGSLPSVEQRLAHLRARRAEAEAVIERETRAAEAESVAASST